MALSLLKILLLLQGHQGRLLYASFKIRDSSVVLRDPNDLYSRRAFARIFTEVPGRHKIDRRRGLEFVGFEIKADNSLIRFIKGLTHSQQKECSASPLVSKEVIGETGNPRLDDPGI